MFDHSVALSPPPPFARARWPLPFAAATTSGAVRPRKASSRSRGNLAATRAKRPSGAVRTRPARTSEARAAARSARGLPVRSASSASVRPGRIAVLSRARRRPSSGGCSHGASRPTQDQPPSGSTGAAGVHALRLARPCRATSPLGGRGHVRPPSRDTPDQPGGRRCRRAPGSAGRRRRCSWGGVPRRHLHAQSSPQATDAVTEVVPGTGNHTAAAVVPRGTPLRGVCPLAGTTCGACPDELVPGGSRDREPLAHRPSSGGSYSRAFTTS
jgi:hypothetical protein